MSLSKVILILVLSGLGLFILFLYLALSPTIRNVSNHDALKSLIDVPLSTQSTVYLHQCDNGTYRFVPVVLSEDSTICQRILNIPVNSKIQIKKINSYRNNAGSGFTNLFVLGEYISPEGKSFDFEYDWGILDFQKDYTLLPKTFWQSQGASQIKFNSK
jgi:hypothetical protein